MRIIAGQHRGRRLLGPPDTGRTRPITDRVKTALFDRLASADRLEGASVADVFSGTGSMGLEALSRGAAHVWFVERDRGARARLEQNLRSIGQAEDATVLQIDALTAGLVDRLGREQPIDLFFFDPPYRMLTDRRQSQRVYAQVGRLAEVATDDAWLILRMEKQVEPPPISPWQGPGSHTYGSMTLHIYRRDG